MRKNTASQTVGAQMITASDGTAFTGSVTCYVTGDAGTQATGSVGSGACTHEGNGFHTYAPAQAETNYNHVAFTFTGSGAIPATVQVYTVGGSGAPSVAENQSGLATPATVWSNGTRTLTAGTNISLAKGTNITGFNDLSAAQVNAEVDTALADYDPPTRAEATSDKTEVLNAIDALPEAPSASDVADEVATRTLLADIRKVNNVTITGTGEVGNDEWRAA